MQRNDVARSYLLKLFFSDNPLRVNGKDGIYFDIFALPTQKIGLHINFIFLHITLFEI